MANGQITASTLNLRTQANTTSAIVASFPSGTIVEILNSISGGSYSTSAGNRTDWHEVKINGQQGFVAAFFIIPTGSPNTTSRILNAINKVNADHPYYKARDITGDGRKETFCNWFFADVLDQLSIQVPRLDASAGSYPEPHPIYGFDTPFKPASAEALFKFFEQQNSSPTGKWKLVSPLNANNTSAQNAAVSLAQSDKVVVVSYPGQPSPNRKQGHIAIVRPDSSSPNVMIAQAGAISSNNLPLSSGFGSVLDKAKFFTFT